MELEIYVAQCRANISIALYCEEQLGVQFGFRAWLFAHCYSAGRKKSWRVYWDKEGERAGTENDDEETGSQVRCTASCSCHLEAWNTASM